MILGMISTLTVGTVVGGLLETHVATAYIVGLGVGVVLGILTGLPFNAMAIIDGVAAGAMGGLMGIMLGMMVPQVALCVVAAGLAVLFAVASGVMCQRLQGMHVHPSTPAVTE